MRALSKGTAKRSGNRPRQRKREQTPEKLENLDAQAGNPGGDSCLHLLRCVYSDPT